MSDEKMSMADKVRRIEWALGAAADSRLIDIPTYELCRAALRRNLGHTQTLLAQMYAKRADLDGCVPTLR